MVSAEIFPWAIAYAVTKVKAITFRIVPIAVIIMSSLLATLFVYEGELIDESIRSLFAYINPLILFMVLARAPEKEILRLAKLLKYVLVGLL